MATIGNLYVNVVASTKKLSKGLGSARGMLSKFGKFAASPAGMAIIAFTGLAVAIGLASKAIMSSVKEFMRFDAAMAEVKSIMLDMNGSEFDPLIEQAKHLGATTAFTAEQSAQGMANLARAGFKAAEITQALPAVLDLAAATSMELAEASDITAVAVRGFGLAASEAAHVADVLALGASKTNTTVSELGEGMSYVAPVAKQFGFTIEETVAMLGKLADAGIKSSKGGTALRTMMLKLGPEIEKNGTQAFRDYLAEGHGVIENFEKFGKLGVTAAGVLGEVGEETAKLTSEMVSADNVVKTMAERRLDTLSGDVTLFSSAMSGLKIAIGEDLEPTFRAVVQVATEFITGLQAGWESIMGGANKTAISVDTLRVIFKTLGIIIVTIGTVAYNIFNKISSGWYLLKTVAAGVLTGISAIIQAIVEVVSWGLNAVGLMSDETYDQTVGFMRDLTVELGKTTGEAGKDAGTAFLNGYLGGAEMKGAGVYTAFLDGMDNGLTSGAAEAGVKTGEAIAEGIGEGVEKGADAIESLTEAQEKLLEQTSKMEGKLEEQIATFGMSSAEALAYKLELEGVNSETIKNVLAMEKQLDAMKEKKQEDEKLKESAEQIIESLRSPQEIYDQEVEKLEKMVNKKLLTLEQFEKALAKLKSGTEDDIEINIITKGIVENLQTALGSVKIAGQVNKTEQLAKQQVEVQKKIEQVMSAVRHNIAEGNLKTEQVSVNTQNVATRLSSTLSTDVSGLQGMMASVESEIRSISNNTSMAETERLLGKSNVLGDKQLEELKTMNTALASMGSGGGALT